MASIQKNLFDWQELDELGDLERMQLILDVLDDEAFMVELESRRGRGRNDYPVRAMWNSVLAGIVYEHNSIESLRRELSRNGDLLSLCGFESIRGKEAVPSSNAYSRFLKILMRHQQEIDCMIEKLVEELKQELPDLGRNLVVDSKALRSHARRGGKKTPDGRRDTDADFGAKKQIVEKEDGTLWEKLKYFFGYKLHLLADAKYELPLGYSITKGSESDMNHLLPLVEELESNHPGIVKDAEYLSADKGYDSANNNGKLWDDYQIKPVIAIRKSWKDSHGSDKTRILNTEIADNIIYDNKGGVYCVCLETDRKRKMEYCGFEKKRDSLKYRCPLARKGIRCAGKRRCGTGDYGRYGRVVRIPLERDRRLFTPLARSSYGFKREHKKRTSVERIFSRLDVSYGFERHYIRGMKKMRMRSSLALLVMLSMALGRVKQKRHESMRSLVKMPAA